jgi:HdeA/HdeB family
VAAPSATPAAPPGTPTAPAQAPSEAQIAPHIWNVDRVRCSDLLHASDEDREAAAMFYYGYLAAKSGIHIINTGRISDNITKVIKECTATPALTVPQAFRRALGRSRARG